jgi:hypothetical protein
MATSVRQAVLAAMLARLQVITQGAGFQTDAGETVFLGEAPTLGPDDPDAAIAILVGDDRVNFQNVGVQIRLPIQICALAKVAEGLAAWQQVEAMLADIIKAVELADRNLGGLLSSPLEPGVTHTLPREPGAAVVGAVIEYGAIYKRAWGQT